MPACRVYNGAQINFSTANAWTTITGWDSEQFDTDNMHDPATNPSRITVRTPGLYLFEASLYINGGVGEQRVARIIRNGSASGSEILGIGQNALTGYAGALSASWDVRLQAFGLWQAQAGDYFEAQYFTDVTTCVSFAGGYSWFGAALLGGSPGPPGPGTAIYGTSLPATPYDGQEAVLVDSITSPTYQWRFRYNASSSLAYKWECVGGSPIYANVDTQESITNTSYADLATVGPQITVPRAGVYEITHGAHAQCASGNFAVVSPKLGAAAVALADGAFMYAASGAAEAGVSHKPSLKTLNANDVVKLQYSSLSASAVAYFRYRWLSIRPVRVS